MGFRYTLEKYKNTNSRYTCPWCKQKRVFVRYVDIETGNHLADHVGRCNRELECGYHYKPKQYFIENGITPKVTEQVTIKTKRIYRNNPIVIPKDVMISSMKGYNENNFIRFIVNLFDRNIAKELISKYNIGTSDKWNGATIFWQVDKDQTIRTGKIMLYFSETGKRVKQPHNHIAWIHTEYKNEDNELKQCLFGEHLLKTDMNKPIAIVESEKTAIISSIYYPQYIWMATGGISNLSVEKLEKLKNRNVILVPDLNAFDKWQDKISSSLQTYKFRVSTILEKVATDEERKKGLDIADFLIRVNYNYFLKHNKKML